MPITATCPTCEHSYNVPDGQRGKRVRCRNCADIFVVGGGKGRGRDDDEPAEVELADDAGPRRKRASDGGGSLRDRLDRDDIKSGRRKGSPDRDRDDDDDDRPRRRGAGGNGNILALCLGIGGVVLLLLIGSVIAVYYSTSRAVNNHTDNLFAELDDQMRRAQNNPNFNPGPIGPIGPIGPVGPIPRRHWDTPKNLDEALEDLRTQGNDGFMRDNRGNFIADRVPPNDARRKEVCDVLWDAQKADGHGQEATRRAFCKWAGKDQAKEVLQLVEAGRNDAMEAAAKLKLAGFEVELCKRLHNSDRNQIFKHLETIGQPTAEKELVKHVNHPDRWVRNDVANALKRWNTKVELVVDQCVADLGNTNPEVVSSALERIAERPPEATRRAAVVKAVKPHLLSTNHDVARHAANVAMLWGTAEIAPDLIAALETPGNPFDKPRLMEKIAEFNTEPCRQAIVRQLVAGDRFRAAALIRKGGAAYEAPVLEVLKSATDFGQKVELIRIIQEIGTMASIPVLQQAAVADMRIRVLADNAARAIRGRG